MPKEDLVVIANDLKKYTSQAVENSIRRLEIIVSKPAQRYLVEMFDFFSNSRLLEETYQNLQSGGFFTPITFKYFGSKYGTPDQQKFRLRLLGDECLILDGFFYDALIKNGAAQVRFHEGIGSSAYQELSRSSRDVYAELAQKFWELSLILFDLSIPEQHQEKKLQEMLEKWQKSKDLKYQLLLNAHQVI